MHTTRLDPPRTHVRSFSLRVIDGANKGLGLRSDGATIVKVGHSEANDLILSDTAVSRFHLRVSALSQHVRVEDVGSTNGSWISGARFSQIELTRTSEVTVGNSVVQISLDEHEREIEASDERFGPMFGRSPSMQRALRRLRDAAQSREIPVLLLGETGTGKEVAARALHDASPRRRGPFVVINCAGLAPSLIESELFGHVKGAFTDAKESRPGPFELAAGGTVFLDEIAELPTAQQTRLLRVLQERTVRRAGGRADIPVDVRIVAATRRDLLTEINSGQFREDLYFRIAGTEVVLPPLRERIDEIPALVTAITKTILSRDPTLKTRAMPEAVIAELSALPWPGNIRELFHTVHRYLVHGELLVARSSQWTSPSAGRLCVDDLLSMPVAEATAEFKARMIKHVIAERGSQARALEQLGVNRSTAYRARKRSGK